MKKIINLVIACIIVTLLCGCGKSKNTYDIELESNPSTGYSWSYTMSEKGIVKFTKDEFENPENAENMVGVSGKQLYQVTGVSKGEVEINFTYSRSWEKSLGASGVKYKFKVDKDLNVKLVSKEEWIS